MLLGGGDTCGRGLHDRRCRGMKIGVSSCMGMGALCVRGHRGSRAASCAGGDGPKAGEFCSTPSLTRVHHLHLRSGRSSTWNSFLALSSVLRPHLSSWPLTLRHQGWALSCPGLSPRHTQRQPESRSFPVCTVPHLQKLMEAMALGVFPAPSTGAVLRNGARRAGRPSAILVTAALMFPEHLLHARHQMQAPLSIHSAVTTT